MSANYANLREGVWIVGLGRIEGASEKVGAGVPIEGRESKVEEEHELEVVEGELLAPRLESPTRVQRILTWRLMNEG